MTSTPTLEIALAQLNPTVGDIEGNLALARKARQEAAGKGAELIVFSELFLTGCPPEGLALKPAFVRAAQDAAEELARDTADGGPAMLIGLPWPGDEAPFNSVALLDKGRIADVRHKVAVSRPGAIGEPSLFAQGAMPGPINFRDVRIGVPICEDLGADDVCECLAETGAELLLSPNGSSFTGNKHEIRMSQAVARVTETGLPLAYVNQYGGQDELVFDGASFVLNPGGRLAMQMPAWEPHIALTHWIRSADGWVCERGELAILEDGEAAAYLACVAGLKDYVEKTGFRGVVLGLSGGVDSALVAAMAVDALGPGRVHCVMLPSRYTSAESLSDAAACAKALGVRYDIIPIEAAVSAMEAALQPMFAGRAPDVTEENIQARIRGSLLMAISNKFGSMLLTTGNKSEASVGYATLYGDMNGGFNPIKDLYKTQVYTLCRQRNQTRPKNCLGPEGIVIPESVLTKPPSAELRQDQKDQDTLPPYKVLDDILECLMEREMPLTEIIGRGHPAQTVRQVERLVYVTEFKRRQSAPGVKITSRHSGRGWRYPIINKFREKP